MQTELEVGTRDLCTSIKLPSNFITRVDDACRRGRTVMVARNLADRGMRNSRLVRNSRARNTRKRIIIIIVGIVGPKVIIIIIKDIIIIRLIVRKDISTRTDGNRTEVNGVQAHTFDRMNHIGYTIGLVGLWNRKRFQKSADFRWKKFRDGRS